jgi:hypothetical protein
MARLNYDSQVKASSPFRHNRLKINIQLKLLLCHIGINVTRALMVMKIYTITGC